MLILVSVIAFSRPVKPSFALTSGTDFSITGAVTAWPSCSGATADLYPGITDCMTYTVDDLLSVPITVETLSLSVVTTPPGCPASLLDLSQADFSGALTVQPGQSNSVSEPLLMADDGNQDSCEGGAVTFAYSGTAVYTEVYAASAAAVSSSNPSTVGEQVTFTVTVTAAASGSQDPVPSDPTGTASFFDTGTPIPGCSNMNLSGGALASASASCDVSFSSVGTHSIYATVTNSDGNFTFAGSPSGSSNTVMQQVNPANSPNQPTTTTSTTTTSTTSTTTPSSTTSTPSTTTPTSTPSSTTTPTTVASSVPRPTVPSTSVPGTHGSGATPAGPNGGLASTGAEITRLVVGGMALLLAGLLMVGLVRRRAGEEGVE